MFGGIGSETTPMSELNPRMYKRILKIRLADHGSSHVYPAKGHGGRVGNAELVGEGRGSADVPGKVRLGVAAK